MRPEIFPGVLRIRCVRQFKLARPEKNLLRPTKGHGGESELTASERDAINSYSFGAEEIVQISPFRLRAFPWRAASGFCKNRRRMELMRLRWTAIAVLLALTIVLGSCGSSSSTPPPTPVITGLVLSR